MPHCRRKLDGIGRLIRPKRHRQRDLAMRKLIVLTAAAAALLVSACNTVSGLGKDAEAAGRAVTGAAEDVKR
jgi:predicted small secreted protein